MLHREFVLFACILHVFSGVKSPISSNSLADERAELTVQAQALTLGPGSVSNTRRQRRAVSEMTKRRARVKQLRRFLLDRVAMSPVGVAQAAAERFEMTPQAMNWHLRRLREEGLVERHGHTRQIRYRLATLSQWTRSYSIGREPAEDVIWNRDVRGVLGELPDNVADIWHYGFTEMFNNAVEHSGGTRVEVSVAATAVGVEMAIGDDGCGVFRKIRKSQCLLDERHAMLELSKGSLTTDPDRHSGNGMFLMCRLFDGVRIISGGARISHDSRTESGESGDWMLRTDRAAEGTTVFLRLRNRASGTLQEVLEEYSSENNGGIARAIVPVRLARYGRDPLVSRSQAKRLLERLERYGTVVLDFRGVDAIGPAFADEIFRVFARRHPDIELIPIHACPLAQKMIGQAKLSSGR